MGFDTVRKTIVWLVLVGSIIYVITLIAFVAEYGPALKLLGSEPTYTIGLPIAAFVAFAIICVFETWAPSPKNAEHKVEFKAFGLMFSGPSGPVILWILCYLALVASTHIVKAPEKTSTQVLQTESK